MKKSIIKCVRARQIIDSRGFPTVEAEVRLQDGTIGRGACPSGASTGIFEAHELRDEESDRYAGKGVKKAVVNVNTVIDEILRGTDADNIYHIDNLMKEADGTPNKEKLGANATLAVSIAVCRAAAKSRGMSLYRYLGGISGNTMPIPITIIR